MGNRETRGGEMGGLKAYYLHERPMLERLLAARLGSVAEAQDVLQDVWLRLETMTASPIAQPGGYLFRMANNIATDRVRAEAARAQREQHWEETRGSACAPAAEAALIAAEQLRAVDATIAALPARTARIFRLHRYDHVPRRAIAETLSISVSAVEKHLQTAYRAIHGLGPDQAELPAADLTTQTRDTQ